MANAPAPDAQLLNTIQRQVQQLSLDPKNDDLRTSIFKNQVDLTSRQLGVTQKQGGDVVRAYTAAYVYSKGQDPQEVLDALNSAQQQIINYDKNKPKLYGMDLVTANQVASYFAAAAGPVLFLSIAAFMVALFTIGPEAAAAIAGAGGVVEAITAVTGVALGSTGGTALAIGGFLFLISQALGHFSTFIPQATKQMVDNGTIAASLQITAIKNVQEVSQKLEGSKAPGPYTSAQFDALFRGLGAAGVQGILIPGKQVSATYSRQALAQLVSTVYGQEVLAGRTVSPSKFSPLLTRYLLKGTQAASVPVSLYDQVAATPAPTQSDAPSATETRSITRAAAAAAAPVRVFTGIVSRGVLGTSAQFDARPDDLIQNAGELQAAAHTNLAAFIAAVPSSLAYELKIVPTITTRDGFTQRGKAQQVVSRHRKDGGPVLRTVVNKFAVLVVSITDERGTRHKLRTINLGPVDALTFKPSSDDIASTEAQIKSGIVVNDASQIFGTMLAPGAAAAISATNTTTSQNVAAQNALGTTQLAQDALRLGFKLVKTTAPNGRVDWRILSPRGAIATDEASANTLISQGLQPVSGNIPPDVQEKIDTNAPGFTSQGYLQSVGLGGLFTSRFGSLDVNGFLGELRDALVEEAAAKQDERNKAQAATGGGTTGAAAAAAAPQTLAELYKQRGKTLPSIEDRSHTYEALGLGPAGFYVGSAEQNTRLLDALIKNPNSI